MACWRLKQHVKLTRRQSLPTTPPLSPASLACEGTPSAHTFSPFVVLLLVTFLLKPMKRIVSQTRCSTGIGQRRLGAQLAVCARVRVCTVLG